MDLAEYASCDGIALADFVRKRKISHRELAHLFADAVEKVNPKINAVIEMYSDRIDAIDDHPALTAPLGGVPFLMKDVGASESGRRQEMGSMLMKGHVADKDSFLTGFFKRAGLALLGRTTTPEFAMGISTESRLTGMTRNPWNLDLMAGGSSGGAAASVAAGIVPLAHGSDNGGSIRIPASVCGLVGLKPSRGRVSLGPDFADPGMLQEFVLTKSVRDTALMLDAVSQPVLGDPYIIIQPRRPYTQEVNSQVEKLRIAWTLDSWKPGNSVDSEVSQCMEEVISECGKAGHDLAEKSPVFDYEEYLHALCAAWAFANYAGIDMCASGEGRTVTEENVEPVMLSFYNYSKGLTGADIMLSEFVLNKFRRIFGKFFEQYDILLTPTLNKLPEPLGKYAIKRTDVDYVGYMRLCDETRIHTTAANVTGQPAITLPLGQSQSGLPIGVQLIARFGEEDKLIQLASSLESTMPWRDRVPSVHASR